MNPTSPRLRRVLRIARRRALLTRAALRYRTAMNAEPCEGCGLTRGRHLPDCEPSDPNACPF